MSYALGLGDVSAWSYPVFHTLDRNEVYVVRLKVTGAPLSDGADLLLFVKALAVAQTMGFDVKGVAAWQDDGAPADSWNVDVIATVTDAPWEITIPVPLTGNDISSLAKKIQADPDLRARFPALQVNPTTSFWGELTAPAGAIDHWRAQPMLWDHTLPGPKCAALVGGCGGPTNAFASPPSGSVVRGKADDGGMATDWPVGASVPLVPQGGSKSFSLGADSVIWGLGLAAALGLGYYVYTGHTGPRRSAR